MRTALRTARLWLPLVLGFVCLVVSGEVGLTASWVLLLAGFALLLDGSTAAWVRATGTGGMASHRQ